MLVEYGRISPPLSILELKTMEQRVLTIKIGRGKIISKPWDFEALCLVDDKRAENASILKICTDAVYYLFEGTKATNEFLKRLSFETISKLCNEVWIWYVSDMSEATKEHKKGRGESKDGDYKLRNMYYEIFKAWGRLPDEIGRQRPYNVFYVINHAANEDSNAMSEDDIRSYYGL